MSRFRRGALVAVAGIVAAVAVAVSALAATPQNVTVTAGTPAAEFKFVLSKKTVKKGIVVAFKVTNKGAVNHDFKIAGKKTAQIPPGATRTLRVTFAKTGKFAYLCTLPSHAPAGMKGTLTVVR